MTHDSCSYIVSAAPLPFIKQYHSLSRSGISVLSLFHLNAGLSFSISSSSSLSFPSVLEFLPKCSFLPFLSFLWPRWSDRCKLFYPAVDVRQDSEVRFGARKLQDNRSGRLPENITGTRIKITFLPKYSTQAKWWKNNITTALTPTENPPKAL